MGPLAIIAGIGLAVGAVGTYASIKNQQKSVKLQKQANQYQRQQDVMKSAQARKEAIRNARLSTGMVEQTAANQGVGSASATLGGIGSIETQLNQGLSFLDGQDKLSDQASIALGKANKYQARAATWNSVAQFGEKIASNAGPISGAVFGK